MPRIVLSVTVIEYNIRAYSILASRLNYIVASRIFRKQYKSAIHLKCVPVYRAADWKLDEPDWTGRLKVAAKGHDLNIKLEDKSSGKC